MKRRNLFLLLPALVLLYLSIGCFFRPIDDGRPEGGHEHGDHDHGHDHEHEHEH